MRGNPQRFAIRQESTGGVDMKKVFAMLVALAALTVVMTGCQPAAEEPAPAPAPTGDAGATTG
jgi:hypothetical protein